MDEKNWMEKIQDSAKDVEIPESLKPETIERKLASMNKEKQKTKSKILKYSHGLGTAAAVALVFVAAWQAFRISENHNGKETAGIYLETETEETSDEQAIGGDGSTLETMDALVEEEITLEDTSMDDMEGITRANSREELYDFLQQWSGEWIYDAEEYYVEEEADIAMAEDMDLASGAAAKAPYETGNYSSTNVQELGVDEGDVVKTDGKYLYVLDENQVNILSVSGSSLNKVSEINLESHGSNDVFQEMYVEGETLVLITSCYDSFIQETGKDQYRIKDRNYVKASVYDLSDMSSPKLKGEVLADGTYHTSRKQGNYLYLLTDYAPAVREEMEDSDFVPMVNEKEMPVEDIYLCDTPQGMGALVAVSVDLENPDKILDTKSLVGLSDLIYMSMESLYITQSQWTGGNEITHIMKFSYENGILKGCGVGTVPGYLNDSLSMNEYEGNLRVVTTQWDEENVNGLYVLDENMNLLGKVEDLARGETIYSSRFMGNLGFFVTFRQMDPLFSVDLSDPRNPKILGELKITGFSSYLHFWGEESLLGIGEEVDPDTGEVKGLKLSMFDISDPSDVKEKQKLVLKTDDSWGVYWPGEQNYKAILADPKKNIIGLGADESYLVFTYDPDSGFAIRCTKDVEGSMSNARGVYVGEFFFLVDSGKITVFDMGRDFSEINEITYK